jgi:hypothetical protein
MSKGEDVELTQNEFDIITGALKDNGSRGVVELEDGNMINLAHFVQTKTKNNFKYND